MSAPDLTDPPRKDGGYRDGVKVLGLDVDRDGERGVDEHHDPYLQVIDVSARVLVTG